MKKQEEWTEQDEQQLKDLIGKRKRFKTEKGHDIQFVSSLLIGEEAEDIVVEAFSKGEIKRDFGVGNTGNLFVEHLSRKEPSGIATTEADYWIFVLDGEEYEGEVFIGISTNRLKSILDGIKWEVNGGDFKSSKGKLVKVTQLLKKKSSIKVKTDFDKELGF